MELILLEKLAVSHLFKKISPFYGNRKITTLFTTARHLSRTLNTLILSTPLHSIYLRFIIIIIIIIIIIPSTRKSFQLPSSIQVYHLKRACFSFLFCTTFPAHFRLRDCVTRTIFGVEYKTWSFFFLWTFQTHFILRIPTAVGSKKNEKIKRVS